MRIFIIVATAALLLTISNNAIACRCFAPPPATSFQRAELVFEGELIREERLERGIAQTLRVLKQQKGEPQNEVVIVVRITDCDYFFESGKVYLVYAVRQENQLRTGLCSNNKELGYSGIKATAGNAPEVAAILESNRLWAEAINYGDAAALDRLFAEDMIVTAGNGTIRDKAGEIKDAVAAPDPAFQWTSRFTTEDLRVTVYETAAVVTGLAKWGFKYKGNEVNNERRYTHTYVKLKDKWRIVAQQTSSNLYKSP